MAAEAAAVLLQVHWSLGSAYGIEIIPRIPRVFAAEPIGCAVNIICPGLETHIRDSPGFPAEFGLGIHLCVELLDRVDRYKRGRIADDRSGVRYAEPHKRLIVRNAVDDKTGVFRANAVGSLRPRAAAGINRGSGSQGDQVLIIAAV